ncbi:hypothetical protein CES85_1080 [Ochrobactrum quorumnocens]|uniref:Uncharacterized protein n=1 Tax=Ochrobactrum quorumnocens TaxID=271865 RepID=A0A248UID5_9HYPH|nr:hypothetical protein CES85_1080 [[Ochrobactrum] quorumnocens]
MINTWSEKSPDLEVYRSIAGANFTFMPFYILTISGKHNVTRHQSHAA